MEQILILEDDIALNQGLCKALKTENRKIVSCRSFVSKLQETRIVCQILAEQDLIIRERMKTIWRNQQRLMKKEYVHQKKGTGKQKLDLTKNTKLHILWCSSNKLTKLDVTKNLDLVDLYCHTNKLTKLNVDKNEKLVCLVCSDNKLTQLRLTNNKQLVKLECAKNQLTQLDTSQNNALVWVDCADNKLTKLDFSASPLCDSVVCNENKLTEIIVPKNMENDRIYYDKNLKVSIKKKTKPVKNGAYFVEDTYNYPYCTFRVTSTKAGNRTVSLGAWKVNMDNYKYPQQNRLHF